MGGYGSTRWNATATRATVDDALRLDLRRMVREGNVRPGAVVSGSLTWRNTRTGTQTASIGYECGMLEADAGWLRLIYRQNDTPRDYTVRLTTTRPNYGGRRWWFICPRTGRRAAVLYLPAGAPMFAIRAAYRLAYSSQREAAHDRHAERSHRLRQRLGCEPGFGNVITKPKGMHWRTFERICREIHEAERASFASFAARHPLAAAHLDL